MFRNFRHMSLNMCVEMNRQHYLQVMCYQEGTLQCQFILCTVVQTFAVCIKMLFLNIATNYVEKTLCKSTQFAYDMN